MENLTEQMAKDFLKSKGYFVDYLFSRKMVTLKYNATDEEADIILADVMCDGGIWEMVESGIEILCQPDNKPFEELTEFDVLEMTRESLINFLYWNDRNGCWEGEDDFPPLTLEQAKEYAIRIILGEESDSEEFGHPEVNQHFLKLTLEKLNK
jgi:hypothetical protein